MQKHCHHEHVMKFDAENRSSRSSGSTTSCSTPAAAAWPARSGSRASITTSRSPSASGCCCRPCARPTPDTLIIADGFSCREQIAGLTGRGALHLAQVIQMAMHEGPDGPRGTAARDASTSRWASGSRPRRRPPPRPSLGAGLLAGVGLVWALTRNRRRPAESFRDIARR